MEKPRKKKSFEIHNNPGGAKGVPIHDSRQIFSEFRGHSRIADFYPKICKITTIRGFVRGPDDF